MTQTMSAAGKPLSFPASYATDLDGRIVPPAPDELTRIVDEIAPHEITVFVKRLISIADSERSRPRFRDEAARCSDLKLPAIPR